MTFSPLHIERAIKKAEQSQCHYRVSAVGFNKRGEMVGSACNLARFSRQGGGKHAEAVLISKYRSSLKTILICRINKSGELLPIEPCDNCSALAAKYGIEIKTVK